MSERRKDFFEELSDHLPGLPVPVHQAAQRRCQRQDREGPKARLYDRGLVPGTGHDVRGLAR